MLADGAHVARDGLGLLAGLRRARVDLVADAVAGLARGLMGLLLRLAGGLVGLGAGAVGLAPGLPGGRRGWSCRKYSRWSLQDAGRSTRSAGALTAVNEEGRAPPCPNGRVDPRLRGRRDRVVRLHAPGPVLPKPDAHSGGDRNRTRRVGAQTSPGWRNPAVGLQDGVMDVVEPSDRLQSRLGEDLLGGHALARAGWPPAPDRRRQARARRLLAEAVHQREHDHRAEQRDDDAMGPQAALLRTGVGGLLELGEGGCGRGEDGSLFATVPWRPRILPASGWPSVDGEDDERRVVLERLASSSSSTACWIAIAVAAAVGGSAPRATARRIPSTPNVPPPSTRRSTMPSVTSTRRSPVSSRRSLGVNARVLVAAAERRVDRARRARSSVPVGVDEVAAAGGRS